MITKEEFIRACHGVHPNILTEPAYMGSVDANFGVRNVATWFPDGEARIYPAEDPYEYETFDNAKEYEDALRFCIDHTPEDYFNDEDYVLDSVDQINAHD